MKITQEIKLPVSRAVGYVVNPGEDKGKIKREHEKKLKENR